MVSLASALAPEWLERGQEPIAVARRGDLLCTSGVPGIDLATGVAPADPAAQFALAFANLARLLAEAESGADELVLLNVHIPARDYRAHIDAPWLAMFPDQADRPARKTNEATLPPGLFVQLHAVALRGEQRRSLEIPGLRHRAPLPMGAGVGSAVFSSVIGGDDPTTGEPVAGVAAQIDQAFANAAALMEQAGGDARGINHLWVFLGDMADSDAMLTAYLRAYPDPESRPARKTVPYKLPPGAAIQLQIGGDTSGRRGNFEVPGVSHHDPIPMASLAGKLFQTSGVHGIDPVTGEMSRGGLDAEAHLALSHVEQAIAAAGGSLAQVAGLTILVRDFADAPRLHAIVAEHFAADAVPALRFVNYRLPDDLQAQFHVTGWIG